jgi:hypothetical protein
MRNGSGRPFGRRRGIEALAAIAIALTLSGCSGQGLAGPSSAAAAPSPSDDPAALTMRFTSSVGGYSILLPAADEVLAAKTSVAPGVFTWGSDDPGVDSVLDGVGKGTLVLVSAPIPAGMTGDQWIAKELDAELTSGSGFEACAKTTMTEPVVIDGVQGVIDIHCRTIALLAIATTGGRAYTIDIRADPPDAAWFHAVLATMRLDPAHAQP